MTTSRRPTRSAWPKALSDADVAVDLIVVDAGETSKSVPTAERLWQQLLEANTDRKSVVFAVGAA